MEPGILTHMGSKDEVGATLFDDPNVTPQTEDEGPELRARALGGVLSVLRDRRGWSVEAAAAHAKLSHMTWRRLEEGRPVRGKSLAAVDQILERPIGTVRRALNDNLLMVDLVRLVGVEAAGVGKGTAPAFLRRFAEQAGPQRPQVATRWPEVTPAANRALAIAAHHVPEVQPTDLQVVNRMIEQLTAAASTTESIRELVRAAARAIPDLIARELDQCEHEIAVAEAEVAEAAERTSASGAA